MAKPKLEELAGVECCEKEEFKNTEDSEDNINLIINRNHLETITENQNSPYSTQAANVQCTTRRMSAQSVFSDVANRGSLPFTAPVMEVFHENELEGKFVDQNKKLPTDLPIISDQNTDYAICITKQDKRNVRNK